MVAGAIGSPACGGAHRVLRQDEHQGHDPGRAGSTLQGHCNRRKPQQPHRRPPQHSRHRERHRGRCVGDGHEPRRRARPALPHDSPANRHHHHHRLGPLGVPRQPPEHRAGKVHGSAFSAEGRLHDLSRNGRFCGLHCLPDSRHPHPRGRLRFPCTRAELPHHGTGHGL